MQSNLFYQLPCAPEQQAVTCYHETLEQIVYADAAMFVASVINPFPKLPEQIDIYRCAFQATGHTSKQPNVAAIFPVYVTDSTAHIRHEVEASLMYYFRTVTEQLHLGERDPSPSYGYLREVRRRMEAITWEEAEATMALYGSPEQCVQKLREAHARCGMDRVICWFNPGGWCRTGRSWLVCGASPRR